MNDSQAAIGHAEANEFTCDTNPKIDSKTIDKRYAKICTLLQILKRQKTSTGDADTPQTNKAIGPTNVGQRRLTKRLSGGMDEPRRDQTDR